MERAQHGVREEQHDGQVQQRDEQVLAQCGVQGQRDVQVQHGVQGQRGVVQALREVLVKASLVLAWGQRLALRGVQRVLLRDEEQPDDERRPSRDERLLLRDGQRLPHGGRWELRAARGPQGAWVQPRGAFHLTFRILVRPRQS